MSFNEPLSPEDEKAVCRLYAQGKDSSFLANAFNTSKYYILKSLRRSGCHVRSNSQAQRLRPRKYDCDQTFFEQVDTQEKAYWLGFVTADGNVGERTLRVGLGLKDEEHLFRMRDAFKSSHPIKRFDRPASVINGRFCSQSTCSELSIGSKQIVESLAVLGVHPNKSASVSWCADLEMRLERHYLRGLVDGDGCFYVNEKNGAAFLSFCGSYGVVSGAMSLLMMDCFIGRQKIRAEDGMHRFTVGGNRQIAEIAAYLYEGATVFLPRKYNKVKHLIGAYK